MNKNIATVLIVLVIFVSGFFLGRWTEGKRQQALCRVTVVEAEKRKDEYCEAEIQKWERMYDKTSKREMECWGKYTALLSR
jgi:hypothetical protein